MIIVAFSPLDAKKQANFPPYMLKIDEKLLNTPIIQFKKQINEYFKPYISPFINQQNLKLSCKQAEFMRNKIPLYMYIDPKQHTQYIQCTTQPNNPDEEEQRWRFAKNLLIYKFQNQQKIDSISQKQVGLIDSIVKSKLKESSQAQVIINGLIVHRKDRQQKWSQFFQENWKDFAHENECVYVKFLY